MKKYSLYYNEQKIGEYQTLNELKKINEIAKKVSETEEESIYLYRDIKKYKNEQEEFKILKWFNEYFDKQLNQSIWQTDYKPSKDPIENKEYINLTELKMEAEIKRKRLKELRQEA